MISNGDDSLYRSEVANFVSWCEENHLKLNTCKTTELIVDFSRNKSNVPLPGKCPSASVQLVCFFLWKVFVNNPQKAFTKICCNRCIERWVIPQNVIFPVLLSAFISISWGSCMVLMLSSCIRNFSKQRCNHLHCSWIFLGWRKQMRVYYQQFGGFVLWYSEDIQWTCVIISATHHWQPTSGTIKSRTPLLQSNGTF